MFENLPFNPFNVTLTDTEFSIKFRSLDRKPLSWHEELKIAAREYKKIEKPIYLGLSGGIDSEIIASLFLLEKIKFIPLILEYKNNNLILNDHDISYAKDFCIKHNLTPLVHTVNANDLIKIAFDKKYFPYYRVTGLYQYIQIYLINLVESLNGFLVAGSGVQTWTYDTELKFKLYSVYLNIYNYMNDNGYIHWPSFFWTTPELIRSYIELPIVKKSFDTPQNFKFGYYSEHIKKQVYHNHYPGLQKRKKYHGYEKFYSMPLYRFFVDSIVNYESSTTKISYNQFVEQFDKND